MLGDFTFDQEQYSITGKKFERDCNVAQIKSGHFSFTELQCGNK